MDMLSLAWEGFLKTYELWVLYLAVMGLKSARSRGVLSLPAKIVGIPLLLVGYAWDWFVNVTVMWVVFWQPPAHPAEIVTARLQRYADGKDCRRRRMAWWIDRHFLRHFDPVGYHVDWPEFKADPNTYLSHEEKHEAV